MIGHQNSRTKLGAEGMAVEIENDIAGQDEDADVEGSSIEITGEDVVTGLVDDVSGVSVLSGARLGT